MTTVGRGHHRRSARRSPRSDYIDEADAICTESNAGPRRARRHRRARRAPRTRPRSSPASSTSFRPFRSPTRTPTSPTASCSAVQEQVDALEERELALERDDTAGVTEIDGTTLATAEADAQAAAEEFGFEVCGEPDGDRRRGRSRRGGACRPRAGRARARPRPSTPPEGGAGTGGGATPDAGGGTGGGGSGSGGVSPSA